MRVTLLAAASLCAMGLPASAQPSKMNPEGSGLDTQLVNATPGAAGVDAQPSKMNPDPSGLASVSGAMRYAGSPWLDHAMHDVGTNPTGWKRQWCAKSMNLWLQRSGMRGCGGNTAISCLKAGRKLSGPQVGALAVMNHHVGIVKEVSGNSVILVSGNHSGRGGARSVGVGKYSAKRVVAYVWPE
jgi:uncharacterized protein (TIGR02594 family)